MQWTQPLASTSPTDTPISVAAAPGIGVQDQAAGLAPVVPAAPAPMQPSQVSPGVGAAIPAASAASAGHDVQVALAGQAQEPEQTDAMLTDADTVSADAMPAEALDPASAQPTDMPGAPPAPVRLEHEQRVAEAIGAQIQAQEVHLAVVNTPESSLLLEVLKEL